MFMASVDAQQAGNGARIHVTTTGLHLTTRQLLTIMGGVMLGLLLAALDQTVVGPAMYKIVRDLHGLEHYTWVTTAYLLTSTVSVPIVGKLGDLYGRKWLYVGGMAVFIAGSALSGLSNGLGAFSIFGNDISGLTTGMAQLILFRALQGVGAGMLTANAFAIIGDLLPPAERGRWQGLFGGVWGLSSVIGPTIGGFITDNIGWRWVFYVNVPIGIAALIVVTLTFPRLAPARRGGRSIDWLGAGALALAVTPLLLALSLGGSSDFPWDSPKTIGMFAFSGVMILVFLLIESKAKEPILPLDLFKNPIFSLSMVTVFIVGMGMFGALINIPLFIQGVQGGSATNSGNSVTPMMFAMIVVSIASGQVLSRTGRYRVLGVAGMAAMTLGIFLLSRMQVDTPLWQTIVFMVIMGLGLGVAMPIYNLIVQNAFPVQRLGVVTSATQFFRSMGGTVGLAVLGTILNNRFSSEYSSQVATSLAPLKANPQLAPLVNNPQFSGNISNLSPQALLAPDTVAALQARLASFHLPAPLINQILAAIQEPIKPALTSAITATFFIATLIVAAGLIATALIPEIPLRRSNAGAGVLAEGAGEAVGAELAADAASSAGAEPALTAGSEDEEGEPAGVRVRP
jgi:EmrB/QacA subfamily drug resistance transporter